MKIKYIIDNAAAKKLLQSYPPAIRQAMVSAVTATAKKARTAIDAAMRAGTGLSKRALSDRVRRTGLRRLDVQSATQLNPTAFLIASGTPMTLLRYHAKQTTIGLSHRAPFAFAAGRKIAGTVVPSGFLARARGKGPGRSRSGAAGQTPIQSRGRRKLAGPAMQGEIRPFIRTPGARAERATPKRLRPDLPISVVYGPSAAELYAIVGGDQIVQRVVQTEYHIILERELAFRLKQVGAAK